MTLLDCAEVGKLLDEITDSFPPALFAELNGSVLLVEEERYDPEAPDLLIMGCYFRDQLGLRIEIYYGSFLQIAEDEEWDYDDWREELRLTLAHELTHHLEGLGGERGLELEDEAFMEAYWEEQERRRQEAEARDD
jgi:hypothetical protein